MRNIYTYNNDNNWRIIIKKLFISKCDIITLQLCWCFVWLNMFYVSKIQQNKVQQTSSQFKIIVMIEKNIVYSTSHTYTHTRNILLLIFLYKTEYRIRRIRIFICNYIYRYTEISIIAYKKIITLTFFLWIICLLYMYKNWKIY